MTTCPKQYLAYNPDFVKVPYLTLTDISQHVIRYKTLLLPWNYPAVCNLPQTTQCYFCQYQVK